MSRLMNLHRIEEAFHHDHVADAGMHRAIQIEQHLSFPEAGRKTVLGFFPVDRASGIGNQLPLLIANRDQATAGKETVATIHPHSKQARRGREDPALCQIRMPGVNSLQGETQRAIELGSRWRRRRRTPRPGMAYAYTKPVPQTKTGFPQTTTFQDRHQVDHMTADTSAPRRDTGGGMAAPHLERKVHGKTLSAVP